MAYKVVPLNGVVQLAVSGVFDFDASRSLLLDIAFDAELCCHGLLIDLRVSKGDLTYHDVHKLIQVLMEHPDAFSQRLALLERYSDQFEKAQFFQAYATERGFQVRAFVDEEAAIAWLERDA